MLVPEVDLWGLVRGELDLYATQNPHLADRLEATALTGATFTRYPLNGHRLTLGYTDLDTRPPIPKAGSLPSPVHAATSIAPQRP
jgi:siderophore synthetase component